MSMHSLPASARVVLDTEIAARAPWSAIIRKGQTLRIIDSHGQQAVDTLFYCASDLQERYSGQDTLRAQGSAYIGTGTRIMSNEGRTMLRVVADSCGLHDTSQAPVRAKATPSASVTAPNISTPAARIF